MVLTKSEIQLRVKHIHQKVRVAEFDTATSAYNKAALLADLEALVDDIETEIGYYREG